jgi:iron complex outermembrane recepter protein
LTQRRLIRASLFISATSLALVAPAQASKRAAEPSARYRLDISAKPLGDALIDLVLASGISIGGKDPKWCRAQPAAVKGNLTPEEALAILLRGSRCEVRRFNATTFALKAARSGPKKTDTTLKPASQDTTVVVVRGIQRLSQSAATISVVTPVSLLDNDQDLTGIATRVPGMSITNLGPGRDKILLRGLSDSVLTGRTQSTVGLYLDDTPLTYNAPDPDLPMVDMAQVEVLKGPQGALYGQGSLSGVVRLVTNKPQLDYFDTGIDIAYGDTQGGRPSTNTVGMINLPLVRDRLALRAVAYSHKAGGFIDDEINGRQVSNSTARKGGRISLKWQVDKRTLVTLSGLAQNLSSANSQYVMGKNKPFKRLLGIAEPHNNRIDDLSATFEREMGIGTLKLVLNRLHHKLLTGYDAQPLAQYIAVPSSGVLYYEDGQSIRLETEEISLVSHGDRAFRWFIGAFAATSNEEFSPSLEDAYTKRILYNENRWDRLRDLALFGRLSYDLSPRWTVAAGVRAVYSRHETDSQINNVRLTGYKNAGDISGLVKDHRLTHSISVRYQLAPGSSLYAQHGDGYRGGGFNTTTLAATAIPSVYLGDHLDSYELGWRRSVPDLNLSFNLVGFHVRWKNIQSDQLRATGLPVTVNIGSGVNTGLEFEADWQPLESLSLHTAALINDPRLERPSDLFVRDKGMGMPYVAQKSLSVNANWRKTFGRITLDNEADLTYRGASPLNYGVLRTVRMDAYANLDLSSAISIGHMRYKVRLDNATSVRSNSFAYGNPFTVASSAQITPVRPRTLWVSLAYKY